MNPQDILITIAEGWQAFPVLLPRSLTSQIEGGDPTRKHE